MRSRPSTSYLILNIAYLLNTLPEKHDIVFYQSLTLLIYGCRYNCQQSQVLRNKVIGQRCPSRRRRRGRQRCGSRGIKEGPGFRFCLNSRIRDGRRKMVRPLRRGQCVHSVSVNLFLGAVGRRQGSCGQKRLWGGCRRIAKWLMVLTLGLLARWCRWWTCGWFWWKGTTWCCRRGRCGCSNIHLLLSIRVSSYRTGIKIRRSNWTAGRELTCIEVRKNST